MNYLLLFLYCNYFAVPLYKIVIIIYRLLMAQCQ